MPPPRESDGHECCWTTILRHRDGISNLEFYDYKGAAQARFDGTTEASSAAVKLVNLLAGMDCLHPYDGTLAGTMA